MNTILYATDYSLNSAAALKLAHLMAKKFDAHLILMHVFDIPITLSTVSLSHIKKEQKLLVENHSKLIRFCTRHLGDTWEGFNIAFVADENVSVTDGILEKALKFKTDLIVVGTRGTNVLKEFFLGSATTALIKKAPCAVLAVPETSKLETFNAMVYATDFERTDIFAINRLVKIAEKFNAQIRVVHISPKMEYEGDQQMEWFKEMLWQKVSYKKIEFDLIFSDQIFEELMAYLNGSEANMIAMLERKDNSYFQRYLQRDLVKKMVSGITIPLLSFKIGGL